MRALTDPILATLCDDIQFNCAISDARHAREYSLCVYLLRMREFYRWRFDIPFMQTLDNGTVVDWISETELHWDDIEALDYKSVVINGNSFDPFDIDAVNAQLQHAGLIYSAGYGRLAQPHFVLAELMLKDIDALTVSFECGKELARDSITMPAMTQNGTIYIRHDSIKRHIWQMLDEWRLQKKDGPLSRIVEHFNLDDQSNFDRQLEYAAKQLSQLYRVHELGEVSAGNLLTPRFQQLLQLTSGTQNEFYLRAVRDILADTLETWPYLVTKRSVIELDFWLSTLTGARLKFLTATGMTAQIRNEHTGEARLDKLAAVIKAEQRRWLWITEKLLLEPHSNISAMDIHAHTLALIDKGAPTLQ